MPEVFDLSAYNAGDLLWLGEWSPTWIAVLAIVGVAVLALSWYDLRSMRRARRWSLLALRGAIFALAVMLLLEPAIDLKHITKVRNHIAVLVDDSRSMSLRTEDPERTRIERVTASLDELDPLVERSGEEHEFHFFAVGDDLESTSRAALSEVEAGAPASDLSEALERVRERFADRDLGGIVLLTDGIDTGAIGRRTRRGEELDEATRAALERLDAPVNTVAAARAEGLRDVAVARIFHDDFAFVHNKVSVDVELQAIGMGSASVPVTLRRSGELLQTETVQVEPGKTRYEVSFEFVPQSIGKEIYSVSVPQFPDEVLYDNNAGHFLLKVIRDKVRVLQVVGRPSWDERFLRRLLKRNPNVDLISFFILRTSEDTQLVPNDELSLIPFPTRELFRDELGSFDLVIFQNFNFGPYSMRQYLPEIEQFVRDGGGFVMVGGDLSFASGGYSGTPIEEILPVELPGRGPQESLIDGEEFRPELSEAGLRHPITQLAFDPASNREIWSELPPQKGTNIVLGARPDATVLAEHPRLRSGGEPMPVLTVWDKGEGRAMALTVDSSWRWGFERIGQGGTLREYQLFWNNAIRWLIKDPELKLVKLEVPDETYQPGSTVDAVVRVSRPDYTPARGVEGTVTVFRRSLESLRAEASGSSGMPGDEAAPERVREISFTTTDAGQARVPFQLDEPGVYRLRAEVRLAGSAFEDHDTILAVPDVEEFRDIIPRDGLLASLSEVSGGSAQVLPDFDADDLSFAEPRTVKINRRKVIQLWDSFVVFGIILLLLGSEWTLRRRWGRL